MYVNFWITIKVMPDNVDRCTARVISLPEGPLCQDLIFFWEEQYLSDFLSYQCSVIGTMSEALPGVLGNRGIMSFISGNQENTSLKMKGANKGNFGEQGT